MSKNYGVKYCSHNSVYVNNYLKDNYRKRKINVKYSLPEKGVNQETGILLLIAGYGAHSNSKIYKKMRSEFSDKYNLVTIQCDYFGYEYMQRYIKDFTVDYINLEILKSSTSEEIAGKIYSNGKLDINEYINNDLKYENKIFIKSILNETLENFNDMGIMQAIDNIVATLKVIKYLKNRNLKFNANKVIIMGNSHGSYLAYLCNAMCPDLYTHILDNSAWVYPKYCKSDRVITSKEKNSYLIIRYSYAVKRVQEYIKMIKIEELYNLINNKCNIVVYHGSNDELISYEEKYEAVRNIKNLTFNLINYEKVDGVVFKSTNHGLGADFIKSFEKFYSENCINVDLSSTISISDKVYIPMICSIDYKNELPVIINLNN